ncbi:unnamed protein product [Hydatigera taeniaeformis]|uniref:Uncharacterized protein n=1 Tax=Hydatigena taeniaeformis TaxID=6205 RepID=A0A0R3WQ24_HYDTA|nr:unnamed protein product [Hydatigera taeniaeformis]
MRKLRGGTSKETKKDKLEKRKDKETINEQVYKLVLPTVGALTLLLVVVVGEHLGYVRHRCQKFKALAPPEAAHISGDIY